MGQIADKHLLRRVNLALALGLFWAALATCAIAAVVYDVGRMFKAW